MKSTISRFSISLTIALAMLIALALVAQAAGSDFQRSIPVHGTGIAVAKATALPCTLKATPSRTKGQIDLSWTCTSRSLRGTFLVEDSPNSKSWASVKACTLPVSSKTSYGCSDTRLRSGTTYYYRLCLVSSAKVTKCGTADVTAAVSAKVP